MFDVTLFGTRYALAPDILLTESGPLPSMVMAIENGRIATVDSCERFASDHPDWPVTKLPGRAITPGFVDSHTHLGQPFAKSATGGEPAQIWKRIWVPLENALDDEMRYVAAVWMLLEAVRGGFTTIVNFTRNSFDENEAVHRAANEVGARVVSSCAVSNDSGSLASIIDELERHIERCSQQTPLHPSVSFGFFGDTLKGLRTDDLAQLGAFCRQRRVLFQMHSNDLFPEVHDCVVQFGKRPIELWYDLGLLGPNTLLHHVAMVTDNEVELLCATDTGVSYNPVASVWKVNTVAPALTYARRGLRMGLGTDSTRMDAFRALDAAETCQRLVYGMNNLDFSCGAAWTWVDAGTRGGAAAAGLSSETGLLAPGLAADFLILDMMRPEVIPSWDFEWELVRQYNRDQIDAVVVGGRPILLHGKTVGWDSDAFIRKYAASVREVVTKAGITRIHGPSINYRLREQAARAKASRNVDASPTNGRG